MTTHFISKEPEQASANGALSLTCYHGRHTEDVERHGLSLREPSDIGTFGSGIYLTNSHKLAQVYANEGDGVVLQADIVFERPFFFHIPDDYEDRFGELTGATLVEAIFAPSDTDAIIHRADQVAGLDRIGFAGEIAEQLQKMGHDGLICTYSDGSQEIVVLPHAMHAIQKVSVADEPEQKPRDRRLG